MDGQIRVDGQWRRAIDVRDFIASNTRPYQDGPAFLAGITARTQAAWDHVLPLLAEELKRGMLFPRKSRRRHYAALAGGLTSGRQLAAAA